MAKLTDDARRKLKGKNFGYLAVVTENGSPHVSPVWVDTDGERVLVNTAVGRVKERAMRSEPRVALSVSDADDPYSHVDIRGRVVEAIDGEPAEQHINELAHRYRGRDFTYRPGERRVLFVIEPVAVFPK